MPMKKPSRDTRMSLLGLLGAAALLLAVTEALPMNLRLGALLAAMGLFLAYAVLYLKDPGNRSPRRNRRP